MPTPQLDKTLEHWKDPSNEWDGTKDIDFKESYPNLLEEIKRLQYWIKKDDGCGTDYGKIENSIADIIDKSYNLGITTTIERVYEEVMMLFVDVDAGGVVTEKENITIQDVNKLFEPLKQELLGGVAPQKEEL